MCDAFERNQNIVKKFEYFAIVDNEEIEGLEMIRAK